MPQCLNPKCQEKNGEVELELWNVDHRVEWVSRTYDCPKCHSVHEHLTTFQLQSSLVAKDEFSIIEWGAGYEKAN
jgi:Zn finger protein HypA/HybF involved in hydrogenase expression